MPDYNINLTINSIWSSSRFIIDVAIMWFVLYYAIKFVRNNARTIQIFKGIVLVLLINSFAKLLGLSTVAYFSDLFMNWGFLAAIIIFQPEIRGLLERLGKTNAFSSISSLLTNEREKLAEEVYEAVIALSQQRIGALISIEQAQSMQDYVRTGIAVNAAVSKELLSSIFMTTTPLHDGAVIIQGDKIACASAYFPPTSVNLSSRYGARHRAALGISEVTDALTIVVSEETSVISIAEKGKIFAVNEKQLKDYLRRVICNDEIEIRKQSKQRNSLLIDDEPEMIVEKEKADGSTDRRNFFSFIKGFNKEEQDPQESPSLDMKTPFNNRLKYEKEHPLENVEEEISTSENVTEEALADTPLPLFNHTGTIDDLIQDIENPSSEETNTIDDLIQDIENPLSEETNTEEHPLEETLNEDVPSDMDEEILEEKMGDTVCDEDVFENVLIPNHYFKEDLKEEFIREELDDDAWDFDKSDCMFVEPIELQQLSVEETEHIISELFEEESMSDECKRDEEIGHELDEAVIDIKDNTHAQGGDTNGK